MLGNFSFGDYFKHEAIAWSWEFLTSPDWVGLDPERLYPSVYEKDDEAFNIWRDEIGIPESRITRLGKDDNFWEHGSGPCGPCSEIYFDRGPEYGCGKPTCGVGCDCDRYMEIWNLVFSQFDADGKGHYERLARPNIDTGMGLERLACVMQNVGNLFEVDTVQSVLHHVEHIAGKTYKQDPKTDISIRVITDHIRSCTFMVSDGILPSNEGRGYVLRRLLRRAARHGRMLGIDHPFLVDLVDVRFFLLLMLQSLIFTLMYMVLPNGRNGFGSSLPGGILSSVGWLVFSDLFSIYVEHFNRYSLIYGSVYALALGMLWLYCCLSILFYGGALNHWLSSRKKC